ncbi:MAG: adenylate/guanylate cyclase domain-containing protein [Deltaproteobacteria bacterium]|nr:adenylate/guanylate cyclase domain-containing protein [Deltaproteobacteria bacterium]
MRKFLKLFLSPNFVSISVFVILFVIVLFITGVTFLDMIELKTFDLRFKWRGHKTPSPAIVTAVIDEESLDKEGRWPWPRNKIADLIKKLSDDGAKVIAFDIFFTEPDNNSNLEFLNSLDEEIRALDIRSQGLQAFIEKNKVKADNDLALAEAISESKARIILSYYFYSSKEALGYEIDQEEINSRIATIKGSLYTNIQYEKKTTDYDPFFKTKDYYAPEVNLEMFSQVAASSGFINEETSDDGVVRNSPLAIRLGEDIFTPFSVQCAWQYLDKPNLILRVAEYGIQGIEVGDTFVPTDESGKLLINYLGEPGTLFPRYSITKILNDQFQKGSFRDKLVIVGSIATGAHDLRNTPFSGEYPGMEVHATVVDNILRNDFISKPEYEKAYDILVIIILGALIGIIVPRSGAIMGLCFTAGLVVVYILGSRWLFSQYGLWVNMVYPLLTIVLTYISLTAYRYLVEEKSKRFLHSTFSSYLSPELIQDMVASNTMPELGGEARMLTAYFTDIQGFSVFSEKLTAHQLVELLNEYLSAMTDIIIRERGTLDKYEGDAIIAFFGAPMHIPDHPLRACRVAVTMQSTLLNLREKWRSEKLLPGAPERNIKKAPPEEWVPGDKWPGVVHEMMMRIGINSGEIVVGNMGSSMRMNYTMMGDAVNLAARLEAGAKQFGIYTCVSEFALNTEYINEKGEKERAMDMVEARFIDNITVVGKSEPVKIYELCAMKGGLTTQEKRLFDIFDMGIHYYRRMQWDEAIKYFRESYKIERIPEAATNPSEVYIRRCMAFKKNPPVAPGQKWDGVFRMTRK